MVTGQQHFGDSHTSVLGGTRELRTPGQLAREAVLGKRFGVADNAWNEPSDGVDQHHGGDLAAAHDKVADRDLACLQAGTHPVVDAFVTAAHDDEAWLGRQFSGQPLVKAPAPGLHQHDWATVVRPDGFDSLENRLGLQHHPRAATKRDVVHLVVTVVRVCAQVTSVKLDQPALDGTPDNTVLKHGFEHAGEDGDDVKSHFSSRR